MARGFTVAGLFILWRPAEHTSADAAFGGWPAVTRCLAARVFEIGEISELPG